MPRLTKITALALLAPLFLVGCTLGGAPVPTNPDPKVTQTSEPTEAPVVPATGTVITGEGFTITAPEGWTEYETGEGIGTTFADPNGKATVLVFRGSARGISLEQAALTASETGEKYHQTDIQTHDQFFLGDNEFGHVSSFYDYEGLQFYYEKFFVTDGDGDGGDAWNGNGDAIFLITFSFAKRVSAEERLAIAKSMLATFTLT